MRRSPLQRRTPLRSQGELRSGSRMSRRSVARRRQDRDRGVLREWLRSERGLWCEAGLAGCEGRWTDMHERLRRSQGGDPLDPDNVMCLCRSCHRWVTEHPQDAVRRGLAAWRWRSDDE